ncbi:MAG: oligosaccharide flippase family protein [Planctomycetes bacterium]|nr:oligosaccharide flippase family protein [Planctomycetota bacterium]MBU1518334.1 oligosaccharide flippase family protein [Planctomycetota bacterium]MBU2458573.1 oligosaccharide flippase family protein [Planctomycetota bacterium]MBU2596043.1 oligosaccharide flippase family protein [Planctomycetota bacterium]
MKNNNPETFIPLSNEATVEIATEAMDAVLDIYTSSSIRKNFSWLLTGNIVTELSLFAVLIVLAKLGSAQIQGRFLLCLGIVTPVAVFTSLGLRALLITDSFNLYKFYNYLYLRIISCAVSVIVCLLIGFYLMLYESSYDKSFLYAFGFIAGFKAFDFVSDICYAAFQKKENMKYIGISKGVKAIGALIVTVILLWFTHSLTITMFGWLVLYGSMTLLYDLPKTKKYYPLYGHLNFKNIAALAKQSVPLVISTVFITLNVNLPRYIIAAYYGEDYVGYFGSMSYVSVAMAMIFVAIGNALLPRMTDYFDNTPSAIWPLVVKAALVVVVICIPAFFVCLLYGKMILQLLFSPQHAQFVEVLWIFAGASVFVGLSSLMGFVGTACRAFTASAIVGAVVLVVTLIGGLILVPKYSLVGAVWTNAISNIVGFVLMTAVVTWYIVRKSAVLNKVTVLKGYSNDYQKS